MPASPISARPVIGAVHSPIRATSPDPGGLTKAYADLFVRRGGRFLSGDAKTLGSGRETAGRYRRKRARSRHRRPSLCTRPVVRMTLLNCSSSASVYRMPLAVKRGLPTSIMHLMAMPSSKSPGSGCRWRFRDGADESRCASDHEGSKFAPREAPQDTDTAGGLRAAGAGDLSASANRSKMPPGWACAPCFPDMRPGDRPGRRVTRGCGSPSATTTTAVTLGPITGRILVADDDRGDAGGRNGMVPGRPRSAAPVGVSLS